MVCCCSVLCRGAQHSRQVCHRLTHDYITEGSLLETAGVADIAQLRTNFRPVLNASGQCAHSAAAPWRTVLGLRVRVLARNQHAGSILYRVMSSVLHAVAPQGCIDARYLESKVSRDTIGRTVRIYTEDDTSGCPPSPAHRCHTWLFDKFIHSP